MAVWLPGGWSWELSDCDIRAYVLGRDGTLNEFVVGFWINTGWDVPYKGRRDSGLARSAIRLLCER